MAKRNDLVQGLDTAVVNAINDSRVNRAGLSVKRRG